MNDNSGNNTELVLGSGNSTILVLDYVKKILYWKKTQQYHCNQITTTTILRAKCINDAPNHIAWKRSIVINI